MKHFLLQTLILLSLIFLSYQRLEDTHVQVLFKWRYPNWIYPSEEARQAAEQQEQYIPQNGAILDSDYYFTRAKSLKRVFVSTPQFRPGIPATLSEVTREHRNGSFLLHPFPKWDTKSQITCDGLVSVYRFHIDKCGLLWALDTGRVDTFTNARRVCRPKLVIYDLNDNDKVVLRYEFPDGSITNSSNLANIITESYRTDCRDSIAYIADVNAYALVMFDLSQNISWRVENPYFYPFPHKATFFTNNVTFVLMDGLFGLALSSPQDSNRRLYFHSLASTREGWIPVSTLKNRSLATNAMMLRKFMIVSDEARTNQSTLEVMTKDGILLYALLARNAIACWNSRTAFRPENQYIVYEDDENLQFVSGMKLKDNQLLITSSRLQNYINGDLIRNDIKYRLVLIDDVSQLLINTPCSKAIDSSSSSNSNSKEHSSSNSSNGLGSHSYHSKPNPNSASNSKVNETISSHVVFNSNKSTANHSMAHIPDHGKHYRLIR